MGLRSLRWPSRWPPRPKAVTLPSLQKLRGIIQTSRNYAIVLVSRRQLGRSNDGSEGRDRPCPMLRDGWKSDLTCNPFNESAIRQSAPSFGQDHLQISVSPFYQK